MNTSFKPRFEMLENRLVPTGTLSPSQDFVAAAPRAEAVQIENMFARSAPSAGQGGTMNGYMVTFGGTLLQQAERSLAAEIPVLELPAVQKIREAAMRVENSQAISGRITSIAVDPTIGSEAPQSGPGVYRSLDSGRKWDASEPLPVLLVIADGY